MNEKIREPNKHSTEDQESSNSRSPGVTDRGLINAENLSNNEDTNQPHKDSKTDITNNK